MIKQKRKFSVTLILILINIILFFIFFISSLINEKFIDYFALNPYNILNGKFLWTVVTSIFVHANFTHLFVNMISLFFLGTFLEQIIGRKRFIYFYIISGIFSALFFVMWCFLFGETNVYAVGASGALFALGGLLMILLPKLKVYVFFVLPMPLWIGMIFMLGILWLASLTANLPIGNAAHLGGLLIGVCYGFWLRKKFRKKVALLNKIFS